MNRFENDQHDEIRDLLVEAGPPAPIPAVDLAVIKNAARKEWTELSSSPVLEGRSVSRRMLAIAATLVLALTAVWLYRNGSSPIETTAVATVELLRGESAPAIGLAVGDGVSVGAEIDTRTGGATSPSMISLRMASGHSVRLHADSKLRFDSAQRLLLERGAVYVDSGVHGAISSLEIVTPLGTVREVGTQYEVRLGTDDEGAMRVRVREGSIALSREGETYSASQGEQLTVDALGSVDRVQLSIFGDEWSWVVAAAPAFDADGQTLTAYLDWVSRETGLEVRYEDPSLELDASRNTVGVVGSLDGFSPEETLEAILSAASGLGYRIEGSVLIVTGPSGR